MHTCRLAVASAVLACSIATSHADVIGGPFVNPANQHAYYLLAGATWTDAEAEAVAMGGHLVAIADADEEAWVYDTFKNFGGVAHYLWIGLTDAGSQGSFAWTTGEPTTYTNWAGGEPTNGASEDYAYITSPAEPPDRAGFWNDIDNSPTLNGVVELDFVPTTTTTTPTTTTTLASTTTIATTSTSSTNSPPTSTTTTTAQGSSTTSTLAGCLGEPEGPSFGSITCRIEALIAETEAQSDLLGPLKDKLLVPLSKARERIEMAATACGNIDAKHSKAGIKKVVRQLVQYSHRLRSRSARKKIAETVREPLAETADGIQDDARTLKATLVCN